METRGLRVLVTGGTAGIGRAIAEALDRAGARVVVCGRDPERLDQALAAHPNWLGFVCDVGDLSTLPTLVEDAATTLGGLDVLVNNAGIQTDVDLATTDAAHAVRLARRELAVDLQAPIELTLAALPTLAAGRSGTVVMVTSALADTPRAASPFYAAAKAGLRAFSKGLRGQAAATGVGVVEVVPPLVRTSMTDGRNDGAIDPDVVADAVVSGLRAGRPRVVVGAARSLELLYRVAPRAAERMVAGR